MAKQTLTVELDEDVILAARAEASRKGQSEAAVVEQALREHLVVTRVVLDPGVLVSALITPWDSRAKLWLTEFQERLEIAVCPRLLADLEGPPIPVLTPA